MAMHSDLMKELEKKYGNMNGESRQVDNIVMRQRRKKMLYDMIPYFWYLAGSLCFAIGTAIVIYRILKGA